MDINRRHFIGGTSTVLAALAAGCAAPSNPSPTSSSAVATAGLVFDPNAFTEQTTTVTTETGQTTVTYRFYGPITYVTKPVNADYQSLVISEPISINGKTVDAMKAPIVFVNAVGGYLPASVRNATGVGAAQADQGGAPPSREVLAGGNQMLDGSGKTVNLAQRAVAAGCVAVEPGCRGRTLVDGSGTYYGTAPAAIVDLKAAVRYLRGNAGRVPGNTDRIVATGTSAGGALSALLAASGESTRYDKQLDALGAADASDAVFAAGSWCPITDLGHADAAYEWNWGTLPAATGPVDQALSQQLRQAFADYQASLKLNGLNGFGSLTADNYADYLMRTHLQPAATRHLLALPAPERDAYLKANPFIQWRSDTATFTWPAYLAHVGTRRKGLPAFDAFDLSAPENNLFGAHTTKARHFTDFGAQHATTGPTQVDSDVADARDLMNPMYFVAQQNAHRSKHWWIRLGSNDTDTALTVSANLAAALGGLGDDVDYLMYWDQGHGANIDVADFMAWVKRISG